MKFCGNERYLCDISKISMINFGIAFLVYSQRQARHFPFLYIRLKVPCSSALLLLRKNWARLRLQKISVSFRLDYEYEIEYEYNFSILVFRIHIITTHADFIP